MNHSAIVLLCIVLAAALMAIVGAFMWLYNRGDSSSSANNHASMSNWWKHGYGGSVDTERGPAQNEYMRHVRERNSMILQGAAGGARGGGGYNGGHAYSGPGSRDSYAAASAGAYGGKGGFYERRDNHSGSTVQYGY
ncbi:hypothetical protein K470DRAFT_255808 [Piedraia hortae CBS 480.64]|uniref:Uncharacterized protein n=1 Tax=Piedraia hortae CBS 480.64 TaxID=1314780 RepID=A0A6A7C569_9PEZI|nr:hypothetical protein K470DRAFT_255808 [Piedraia hortae CBS 480.64]